MNNVLNIGQKMLKYPLLIVSFFVISFLFSCAKEEKRVKEPVDYVDPLIGSEDAGNVIPGALRPHGMVKLSPDVVSSPLSGYEYADSNIVGFSHTHLQGTGGGSYGHILIYPMIGSLDKINHGKCFSSFKHANETAEVGYYSVVLDESKIKAELAVTQHAGIHRYTFPKSENAYLLLDVGHALSSSQPCTDGKAEIVGNKAVKGFGYYGFPVYFYAEFSKPFDSFGTWSGAELVRPFTIIDEKYLFADKVGGIRGLKGEYYDNKTLSGKPVFTRIDKTINYRWGMEHPKKLPLNGFSIRWTGKIVPPKTGTVKLRIDGDDGIRFWVDGKLLIDQWVNRGETADIVSVELQKDKAINIKIEYYENVGVSLARLKWDIVPEMGELHPDSSSESGDKVGAYLHYKTQKDESVMVKVGISHISTEQARKNLENEISGWDFEGVKNETKEIWNKLLKRMYVEGGTENQKTIFYTSLYHSLIVPTDYTEDDQYYSGVSGEGKVYPANGRHYYSDDWCTWDTFRSTHPLQTIIEAERQSDYVWSYLQMYEHSGCLPSCPALWSGCSMGMNSNHTVSVISDIYNKGYKDFDAEKIYEAMRDYALEYPAGYNNLSRDYLKLGYVPFEYDKSVREKAAASITLECAYDDWCVAQMAKALGKEDDYEMFLKRAVNYKNLFDPESGFMRPRHSNGKWKTPFNPQSKQGHSNGFTESNSYQMTFFVPQDIAGLIKLMGGKDVFEKKLDYYFSNNLHNPGNEPDFINPFLYNYVDDAWKTQSVVRNILQTAYTDKPRGLRGNDDSGAMSAWYVFGAAGFYPVTPGYPEYVITSPLFEKITINNGADKKPFIISAKYASIKNGFIQSAVLNGKNLAFPLLKHSDIAKGGTLELIMGDRPNRKWGKGAISAYYSISK
jgi:putative alpha-1,2-mannosidase